MAVSQKVRRFMEEGGWIRRVFEEGLALKAQIGADKVFDLSLGNPVMEPPQEFQDELRRLANAPLSGMHRYMPNPGYMETRQAVADTLSAETGLDFSGGDVIMTCGAAAAANVVLKTILNEGDEVIILAPYFFEYLYYIDNHGGVAVVAACDDQFQPDLAKIEAVVTEKTRAILINSPNNPSGAVYSEERLTGLAALLERKQAEHGTEIFIISDEPYRRIIFDGISFPQVLPQYDNSVVVTSHAKDLALPGERIGYIAVNPIFADKEELSAGLSFCNRTLGFVNAPALMQHIVRNLQGVSVDAGYYEKKRDYLCRHLGELGYDVFRPQGAFYLFPKAPIEDDVAFCKTLLNSNVLVVPGRGFGTSGYFRISYCVEDWVLEGAVKGFAAAMATPEG
ncbi:MAG: pyridoxal phosphate-dependent aminotransferase [Dehalococcoidia bacterium]|nr:pyridoxal phosphate-dependent aminotransferase [Dehalococcoidia bacterium]